MALGALHRTLDVLAVWTEDLLLRRPEPCRLAPADTWPRVATGSSSATEPSPTRPRCLLGLHAVLARVPCPDGRVVVRGYRGLEVNACRFLGAGGVRPCAEPDEGKEQERSHRPEPTRPGARLLAEMADNLRFAATPAALNSSGSGWRDLGHVDLAGQSVQPASPSLASRPACEGGRSGCPGDASSVVHDFVTRTSRSVVPFTRSLLPRRSEA